MVQDAYVDNASVLEVTFVEGLPPAFDQSMHYFLGNHEAPMKRLANEANSLRRLPAANPFIANSSSCPTIHGKSNKWPSKRRFTAIKKRQVLEAMDP